MNYDPSECQCAMCKLSRLIPNLRDTALKESKDDLHKSFDILQEMEKIIEDERQGKKTFPSSTGNEH